MGKLNFTTAQLDNFLTIIDNSGMDVINGDLIFNDHMVTSDGGLAIKMINKTGANTIKGTLVEADHTVDNAFDISAEEVDTIGVVYEAGIADGSDCWIVISGKAQVLLTDTTASTAGNWVYSDTVDGRANATLALPPGGTIGALESHLNEIGHCLETKSAGTDVLALIDLHFN